MNGVILAVDVESATTGTRSTPLCTASMKHSIIISVRCLESDMIKLRESLFYFITLWYTVMPLRFTLYK